MSYASGESAALTLIRALNDFNSTNSVSLANDSTNAGATLLSNGKSDRYVMLRPGPFISQYMTVDNAFVVHEWQTIIKVVVLKQGTDAPEHRLADLRGDIIDKLDGYFQLNNTAVSYAKVVGGDAIAEGTTGGTNGTQFIYQEMVLEWHEESTLTQSD